MPHKVTESNSRRLRRIIAGKGEHWPEGAPILPDDPTLTEAHRLQQVTARMHVPSTFGLEVGYWWRFDPSANCVD